MHICKTALLLLFAFNSLPLIAKSFERGKIILSNGDTLHVLIQNQEYDALSYQVVFKNDRKSSPSTYRPDEVKSFEFSDGDYFESHQVSFDIKTPIGWQHVSGRRFLYRLEKGAIDLFELRDNDQKPLFFRKNGGELKLLCYSKDGGPLYHDLLTEAFADCPQMEMPSYIELTIANIQTLIADYNDCENLEQKFELPFIQAMGFVGTTLQAVYNNYKGFNKGISIEVRPFRNGLASLWNFGLEGQLSNYTKNWRGTDFSRYKTKEIGSKARFFLPTKQSFAVPFGFIGAKYRWYEQESYYISPDGFRYGDNYRSWQTFTAQVGIGLQSRVKRHFFRLEIPLDSEARVRVGYGFVLW